MVSPESKCVSSALPRVSSASTLLPCSGLAKRLSGLRPNSSLSTVLCLKTASISSAARRISGPSGIAGVVVLICRGRLKVARLVAPVKLDRCEPELRFQLTPSGRVPGTFLSCKYRRQLLLQLRQKSLGLAVNDSNPYCANQQCRGYPTYAEPKRRFTHHFCNSHELDF